MAFDISSGVGENSMKTSPVYIPKPISDILVELSMILDPSKKSTKLNFYVQAMEEEMGKVELFKRELPYCMHLLKEAIETLKKEKAQWKGKEIRTVMVEEFMSRRTKRSSDDRFGSVQLWTTPVQYEQVRFAEDGVGRQFLCNYRSRRGAILPFHRPMQSDQADHLSLLVKEGCRSPRLLPPSQQRKQRRCWSPELHKRFVHALQLLGGPNTATPKQIRALMKVEGLTNDEVKSHLQKYRLHIRKLPRSVAGTTGYTWLKQEDLVKPVRRGHSMDYLQSHVEDDKLREAGGAPEVKGQ